jgi:hypothetical protein
MVVELLNTGIESAIDRIGPEWHALAKRAKEHGERCQSCSACCCALACGLLPFAHTFSDAKPQRLRWPRCDVAHQTDSASFLDDLPIWRAPSVVSS